MCSVHTLELILFFGMYGTEFLYKLKAVLKSMPEAPLVWDDFSTRKVGLSHLVLTVTIKTRLKTLGP